MTTMESVRTYCLYLNGEWVAGERSLDVRNPASSKVFAKIGVIGREGVARALEHAEAASPRWRRLPARTRGEYLAKIAEELERREDTVARVITLENGKPLQQSRAEVRMAADHFRWFAEEGRRSYGRVVPHQVDGKRHMVLRVPSGVVGAIVPWNFPLALAARKVAPALAVGCPILLKPSSETPINAALLAEIVHDVGLPPGVFQLVVGGSREIGAELLSNPICRKISFTGSTPVGKHLMREAADAVKKLSLELGGNAPVLVFADANVEQAVAGVLIAKFRNTGQSCVAANRIYVQQSIFDKFMNAFVAGTRALKVGNGLDNEVEIGPLINERALEEALLIVERAKEDGATIVHGGKRWNGSERGYYLEPTIMTDIPDDARCMSEELFAPIASVVAFEDEEEVVDRANKTEFGLAAYAFTNDLSRAWRLAEGLEAGTVGINDATPATSACPFGGMKQSGLDRELGSEGIDAYLETKHIALKLDV